MIYKNEMDRIIGDYLEINGDISAREFNSKLPKFISKIVSKRQRKKLLASVDKFRKSEYILNSVNLIELFTYVYNTFDDTHSYKEITNVDLYDTKLEVTIEFDQYVANIYFDQITPDTDSIKFNLKMKKQYEDGLTYHSNGIDIYIDKLIGNSRRAKDFVNDLNNVLKNCIADYIEWMIKKFMEE